MWPQLNKACKGLRKCELDFWNVYSYVDHNYDNILWHQLIMIYACHVCHALIRPREAIKVFDLSLYVTTYIIHTTLDITDILGVISVWSGDGHVTRVVESMSETWLTAPVMTAWWMRMAVYLTKIYELVYQNPWNLPCSFSYLFTN